MARGIRLEVEGGLYHLITRGVGRMDIFHGPEDHQKFLDLLAAQKSKLPFYLYAYCLMTNHFHLLIERRADDVGRVMHRVLTGYTQYYNRKYRRSGHVMQGRHRSILCQSDPYLAELVRYIHLNPVRAKMVERPEDYPFSSHHAYMGTTAAGIVDVDPLLRRFGRRRAIARERYAEHMAAGMGLGHQPSLYTAKDGVLGSDEFVDATIHRMGEFDTRASAKRRNAALNIEFDAEALIAAVESITGVSRTDFCGRSKNALLVTAKEALIAAGRQAGASTTELSKVLGISSASISRRHDAARDRMKKDQTFSDVVPKIVEKYKANVSHEES